MGHPSPAVVAKYETGDLVRLRATVCSTDLVTPADASTTFFLVKSPDGSVATYTGSRAATGGYLTEVIASGAGLWPYRFIATGGVIQAEEWKFLVGESFVL